MTDAKKDSEIQGEGDYRAARRHRRDVRDFVSKNDTERLARDAAPRTEAEQHELLEAERKGRARAKGTTADKRQDSR